MLPNPKLGHAIIPHGGEEEGKPLSLRILCRHRLEGEGNIHRNSLPPREGIHISSTPCFVAAGKYLLLLSGTFFNEKNRGVGVTWVSPYHPPLV